MECEHVNPFDEPTEGPPGAVVVHDEDDFMLLPSIKDEARMRARAKRKADRQRKQQQQQQTKDQRKKHSANLIDDDGSPHDGSQVAGSPSGCGTWATGLFPSGLCSCFGISRCAGR
jgi:hypothetical protein